MGFEDTVELLQGYHPGLWFNASLVKQELAFCDRWTGGEILSGAGRLLAMQAGHPDEWKLNFDYNIPDSPFEPEECEEGICITLSFLKDVRLYMTFNVYPRINDQGDFIKDHTPDAETDVSHLFSRK